MDTVLKRTLVALIVSAFALPVTGQSTNRIEYRSHVSLKVGQAKVIHGYRGDCGNLPKRTDMERDQKHTNAQLKTGHIVYGKEGIRKSRSCEGQFTPAIEIIFVADRKGRETAVIHGDRIKITVK